MEVDAIEEKGIPLSSPLPSSSLSYQQQKWNPRRKSRWLSSSSSSSSSMVAVVEARATHVASPSKATLVCDLKSQLRRRPGHERQPQKSHPHPQLVESSCTTTTTTTTSDQPNTDPLTNTSTTTVNTGVVVTPERKHRFDRPTKSSQRRSSLVATATSTTTLLPRAGCASPPTKRRTTPRSERMPLQALSLPNTPAATPRIVVSIPRSPSWHHHQPQQIHSHRPLALIYLIRHGESQGQACPSTLQRRTDPSLRDCGLTPRGRQQAMQLQQRMLLLDGDVHFDLVVSSPLTRALETALLMVKSSGHQKQQQQQNDDDDEQQHINTNTNTINSKIVVHYDLREIGDTSIPENQPRPWSNVRRDLNHLLVAGVPSSSSSSSSSSYCHDNSSGNDNHGIELDTESLAPANYPSWPQHHDITPRVVRRNQVQDIFRNNLLLEMAQEQQQRQNQQRQQQQQQQQHNRSHLQQQYRPHCTIAVVCHYHVIRAALRDDRGFCDSRIQPANAEPIPCLLWTAGGPLVPLP